jgi:hypothetical protein
MARIRSVKPEFWDDRKLAKRASRDARLLYIALWNLADEWARLNGDPQWIKGKLFAYDDDLDTTAIGKLLEELENPALGCVVAYEVDGDPYLFLPKLGGHQRLEPEKVPSRLPEPPAWANGPRNPEPPPAAPTPPNGLSESRADSSESRADEVARRADEPESHADKSALLYVAGSMEQVAGGRGARGRAGATPAAVEIPDGWKPSDALLRWANATYPGLDLHFEAEQFCRHYRATGDRRKSWPDQWQKWIADSHKRSAAPARASPPAADRRQQATDAQFDRAMQRAIARDEAT